MTELFAPGKRIRLPHNPDTWLVVDFARQLQDGGWILYAGPDGQDALQKIALTAEQAAEVETLSLDSGGRSSAVIAGLWTAWLAAVDSDPATSLLPSTSLRPYRHQVAAVYGAMLPQPRLRFLLCDEPGTGKTVMAGLYIREMQRLGAIRRALVVVPAGLVSKWQSDIERFFGTPVRRITANTARERALEVEHDLWIVSMELAAVNMNVQDAIHPDQAGWDLVVFDEAHRLTPTAQSLHRLGRLLSRSPRVLAMTATPHRGSEWLFRHLLHLVDPEVYPDPGDDPKRSLTALRPGSVHFLRRMKEDLVDIDGVTPLFTRRRATNLRVPLNSVEHAAYTAALALVDQYFPSQARPLARMVYGKRAASSLHALAETLSRRTLNMGAMSPVEAAATADPYGEDTAIRDEARVTFSDSTAPRSEQSAVRSLLSDISTALGGAEYVPSKWSALMETCLWENGIRPNGTEQAVIFTEFADSAVWIVRRLSASGYDARIYSGRLTSAERDEVRRAFMAGLFQIIVSTDAGNEGIDLQTAHVLVNYDIPWSLVRLEQRMGRIHRVGQTKDVELYNLVAAGTREGDTLLSLLENFVTAANELGGKMFDSLSLIAELAAVPFGEWLQTMYGDDEPAKRSIAQAAKQIKAADLKRHAESSFRQDNAISTALSSKSLIAQSNHDLGGAITPAIVGAFLQRLSTADVLRASHTAAGEGILQLDSTNPLPMSLGGRSQVLVSTEIVPPSTEMTIADASAIVPLRPGTVALNDLLDMSARYLAPEMYRGGVAADPLASTAYELLLFASELASPSTRRTTPWSALIRVDANGDVLHVGWEVVGNLITTESTPAPNEPLTAELAENEARHQLAHVVARWREERHEWLATAKRELTALPVNLTLDIDSRSERIAARDRLAAVAEDRLDHLERLCCLDAEPPRLLARLQVVPTATPEISRHRRADAIACSRIRQHLTEAGWQVDDTCAKGRGFDLLATRGSEYRLIVAKGIWSNADTGSILIRGDELLLAAQFSTDHWLYVVESCGDGLGSIIGTARDPLSALNIDLDNRAYFELPGTALRDRLIAASNHSAEKESA
ncbi:helicase-related protein [Nocardia jejuensis]|uniref:helicase-related protein n=1 Tax=Nocardia jejuensis TaxID=328049 RepID=UPI000834DF8D|nr:helicase-related protein [Nocardia jejuensis]